MRSLPFLLIAGFALVMMAGEADAESSPISISADQTTFDILGNEQVTAVLTISNSDTRYKKMNLYLDTNWPSGPELNTIFTYTNYDELPNNEVSLTRAGTTTVLLTIFCYDECVNGDINLIEIMGRSDPKWYDGGTDSGTESGCQPDCMDTTPASESSNTTNTISITLNVVSPWDSYVTNFSIVTGDGLAGFDHPMTFDLGMHNVPVEGTQRLHFNISIDGTFGWGEVLELSSENTTGFYPVGTGYSVSGNYAYIDFNSSYRLQTVAIPWIPEASRSDTYNITVEVNSEINVKTENDEVYRELTVEKLTTNLLVESIKVTDSQGSATIKVTIGYPQGEQSDLNVNVGLLIYRASDYDDGKGTPIDSLTVKTIEGILKGDSRPVLFTWAHLTGDFIFVAVVDPIICDEDTNVCEDKIKEVNELDNSYPSLLTTFETSEIVDTGEDDEDEPSDDNTTKAEDDSNISVPSVSLVSSIAAIGIIALRRRY